ncbi:MAG: HAMP domain-containing histidine kinase [Bacteroides sp.]|nr:HAMP domain-containing histidine kinase [Bacteroides sp.]MCM1548911.1 HAMP domain-containing histidine kinase [Clostridium sp.]
MNKRFFDKIALSYLAIIMIIFIMIILYASNATRQNLITEKQTTLANQTRFIYEEYITLYQNQKISAEELQDFFNDLDHSLDIRIWYSDEDGNILFLSQPEQYETIPENLHDLDSSGLLSGNFTFIGTFYDIFPEEMLTLGGPADGENVEASGILILHVPFSQISDIMKNMFLNFFVPICVLIILSMLLLLFLSRKILVPLNQLNQTAKEYAAGNLEIKTGIHSDDEIGELASNLEYMASELNKLDEYRKAFIANISHDFRSPLTSIKGYIEAMLDGTIPRENQEHYLKIVLSETQRLAKLTNGMLDLNQSDFYGLKLIFSDFNIKEIIDDTIDVFEGICTKRYIVIRKNCLTTNTMVYADKTKIQQVIYNLVDNAIKFSPHGATITITVMDAMERLWITVKDTGQGIEKEKQSKVWDRFYKIDSSRGKDKQSSGLGLSIIREIIRAHDETITLTSTPGIGSEFTFSLKKSSSTHHS